MARHEPTGLVPSSPERVAELVAPLVPASLASIFDARFTRSDRLFDEYVARLTLELVRQTRIGGALSSWGTVEEIVARAGLDARCAIVPVDWMLRRLAARGDIDRERGPDGWRWRARDAVPAPDPAEIREAQARHDPSALPSYTLAETAARAYPGFLEGAKSGEELLLAPARLTLWNSYFSNEHVLYAVNNRVAAAALAAWLPPGPVTLLELGAGMGSGTTAALEALRESKRLSDVTAYRVSDVVPTFLRYAERRVREAAPDATGVTFGSLDMNKPFAAQGVGPGTLAAIYAVNTVHVAHDLAGTLGEIRAALRPHGQIILGECVRPRDGQALYPEFVFNMLTTFRGPRLHPGYRPNGGFLTPEQWRTALEEAGFEGVRLLPDITRIRDVIPEFSVAAIGATRC